MFLSGRGDVLVLVVVAMLLEPTSLAGKTVASRDLGVRIVIGHTRLIDAIQSPLRK